MSEKAIAKEYEFIKPLIYKIVSVIDSCTRDCHFKYFLTIDHICVYDIKLTNSGKNEIINSTIFDKSISLYELIEKLINSSENGFKVNQKFKLKKKIFSNLSNINMKNYTKLRIPIMH